MRLLIHPTHESALYNQVVSTLNQAVADHSDNWLHIVDEPDTVDHYAYVTQMFASVILTQEYESNYMRLTLNHRDPVSLSLIEIVKKHYSL